jgi:isopenicillin N synthase-like dioxygenase
MREYVRREKMAMFAAEIWRLVSELVEAVTESLGLGRGYLRSQMDRGFEMMALNYYPPWPSQDAGAAAVCCAPHTDYTVLTAVVASSVGLEYMDRESGSWRPATAGSSALLVHVGNYLEVVSNGRYRAALHRVVSHGGARVSVTSLTSFAMEESVEVAEELVEESQPPLYRGSTLSEFLDFLSAGSRGSDFFMEQSLKITPDKF